MTMPRRRFLGGAAALTLASLPAAGAPAAAAGAPGGRPRPARVDVTLTHEGWELSPSGPLRAGVTGFHATTRDESGHYFSILRMRRGTTIERAIELITAGNSDDPEIALPARRALYREVDFNGGAAVYPGRRTIYTTCLRDTTYHLGEAAAQWVPDRPPFHVAPVEVTGPGVDTPPLRADVRLTARQTTDGPVFDIRGRFPADSVIRFDNKTPLPQEIILRKLIDGKTAEDVAAYYDSLRSGSPLPEPYVQERFGGMLPISPGRRGTVRVEGLPTGLFSILSHVKDPYTGETQASQGAYSVVELC
ncbi:hypothetical protein HDA32_000505 [Spinactinospora alkalitolerans]|uniref:Uncharacterized protein n=1 Tax=Spinactinospora alkalitolerans TaxID=687207 RepID=A0A852TP49_9ACTN|nr:hypothetical protein [Spinactinospora alkalitolerans]NYE45385.1 hypothetical protein [Spinactinospora alkalitolerans]